jgi:hypothetical protein
MITKITNNLFPDNTKDANGFVHLTDYPMYQKIIDKIWELPNWIPLEEKEPNYPWKYKDNGLYRSYVEIFVERLFNNIINKWIVLCETKYDNYSFKYDDDRSWEERPYINTYDKTVMLLWKIEYSQSMNSRYLDLSYFDIYGNYQRKSFKLHELSKLSFRYCTDDEIAVFTKMMKSEPKPYLERFIIKPEYKEDYNLYKADCEKYGYPIWDKTLVDNVTLYTLVDKEGHVYGGKSIEVIYVNM